MYLGLFPHGKGACGKGMGINMKQNPVSFQLKINPEDFSARNRGREAESGNHAGERELLERRYAPSGKK